MGWASKKTMKKKDFPPLITFSHLHVQVQSGEKWTKGKKKDKSVKGKNGKDAPPMATSHGGEGEGVSSPIIECNNTEEEKHNDRRDMNEGGVGMEKNSTDNAGQGEGDNAPPTEISHGGTGEEEPSPRTERNNAEVEENNEMMVMNERGGGGRK